MSAVAFDTLKYAEALKAGGVPEAQAKAQAAALADALQQGVMGLATKGDIAELRMATKADIAELKAALEARFAPLESDLRWTKWIITGGVGLYALRSLIEWLR